MNCYEKYCSICGKEKKGYFVDVIGKYSYHPCDCETKKDLEEKKKTVLKNKTLLLNNYKEKSGISGMQKDFSFDNFKCETESLKKLKERIEKFCESITDNLIIIGGVGTGKTHLSCSVVNKICENAVSGLSEEDIINSREGRDLPKIPYSFIISENELIKCFREYFKFDSNGTSRETIKKCKSRKLLIIDDLGVRTNYTENDLSMLYDVIDYRYNNRLPIVITSNMTPEEIKKIIGERCYDRLKNNAEVITIKGSSYRKAKFTSSTMQ